jgi:hypothetical protein
LPERDTYSEPNSHTDSYAQHNANTDADSNVNTESNANGDTDGNSFGDTIRHTTAANSHANRDGFCYTSSNPSAATHSATASYSAGLKCNPINQQS